MPDGINSSEIDLGSNHEDKVISLDNGLPLHEATKKVIPQVPTNTTSEAVGKMLSIHFNYWKLKM